MNLPSFVANLLLNQQAIILMRALICAFIPCLLGGTTGRSGGFPSFPDALFGVKLGERPPESSDAVVVQTQVFDHSQGCVLSAQITRLGKSQHFLCVLDVAVSEDATLGTFQRSF